VITIGKIAFAGLLVIGSTTYLNDPFTKGKPRSMPGLKLAIGGEVDNPTSINPAKLPIHAVLVKEMRDNPKNNGFIGAYRYTGHSLLDILKGIKVKKRKGNTFKPPTGLFVTVANAKGDKATISWGEIFYTAKPHRILIATTASFISPTHLEVKWPCPKHSRLICGDDLKSWRTVSAPTSITIHSCPIDLPDKKGYRPLYSHTGVITASKGQLGKFSDLPFKTTPKVKCESIGFGHGHGFHGAGTIEGYPLRTLIVGLIPATPDHLKRGLVVAHSIDGYRATFSLSELYNRNDQGLFLLRDLGGGREGGRYQLFPGPDFFADRGVKAIKALHFHLP